MTTKTQNHKPVKFTEAIIYSIILSIVSYIFSNFTAIIRFNNYPQLTSIMNHRISPIFLILAYIFAGITIALILLQLKIIYFRKHKNS